MVVDTLMLMDLKKNEFILVEVHIYTNIYVYNYS